MNKPAFQYESSGFKVTATERHWCPPTNRSQANEELSIKPVDHHLGMLSDTVDAAFGHRQRGAKAESTSRLASGSRH